MKKNDIFIIRYNSLLCKPIVEGNAKLLFPVLGFETEPDGKKFWEVQFTGDTSNYQRWIDPADASTNKKNDE